MSYEADTLPQEAMGLKLYRIDSKERLSACEDVMFLSGRDGVDTVLRRAQISGRVELAGTIENHFADVLNRDGDWIETIALDAKSYGSLKNHWMRCKVVSRDGDKP